MRAKGVPVPGRAAGEGATMRRMRYSHPSPSWGLALVLAGLLLAVVWAIQVPIVEWSLSRDACVRVEPPEAGSCAVLPSRYERVWVP